MSSIDPELITVIQESVNAITQQVKNNSGKQWFDYVPIFLTSSAPIIAVLFSYIFFNKQHTQSTKAKIAEKDVERLYEAADLFFEYADSLGLFFSMTEEKSKFIIENKEVPPSINKKAIEAAESVYLKFRCIHKAEFLLLSLDAGDVAEKVGKYREDTIEFRKKVVAIAKWEDGHDYPSLLNEELINSIKAERIKFIAERKDCLTSIAACKLHLKNIG